ncbi:MAG: DEAD/DEAH box helicase family protein, partial [Kiritimatiellae bacterium]|nr:DEAD/DEAH box helicase family protein [Kiritimatiellia bacterium]
MASYTLLYCAEINDEKHKDMLKVGETTFNATQELENYTPNHEVLAKAAKDRIKGWSGTAAAGAKLVYCEALIRYNPDTKNKESFGDKVVHRVLNNAGFPKQTFDEANDSGKEWFKVNIETVKAAIKAAKEYRDYLDSSEVPEQEIYDLRQEQKAAVEQTIPRFINHDKKKHKMLWDCKMRFGKTTTALNLVKRLEYKRTIIITHRPVVEDSWGSDFYHVFSNKDNYAFITKISQTDVAYDVESTDKSIDEANDKRLKYLNDNNINFVYFASIQDLVGSKIVGGKYVKNKSVFDIKWDLVIIDEAHEGIRTTKAEKVLKKQINEGYNK